MHPRLDSGAGGTKKQKDLTLLWSIDSVHHINPIIKNRDSKVNSWTELWGTNEYIAAPSESQSPKWPSEYLWDVLTHPERLQTACFSLNSFHLRRLLSFSCQKCRATTQSLFSADRSKARLSPTAKSLPWPPPFKPSEHIQSTSPPHTVHVQVRVLPVCSFGASNAAKIDLNQESFELLRPIGGWIFENVFIFQHSATWYTAHLHAEHWS